MTLQKKHWLNIAFGYLLITALLGGFLRYLAIAPVDWANYGNILHGHSHVAFLGWMYNALFIALVFKFIPAEKFKLYRALFILTQLTIAGMLFSFPVQGYGSVSITCSVVFLLLSYWFIFRFIKDTQYYPSLFSKHRMSLTFIHTALFYLGLSSIGPWALGPLAATGMNGTDIYQLAIYFYLHFQYNGWFTFAVLGLFIHFLEERGVAFQAYRLRRGFRLLHTACMPAFLLSMLWMQPSPFIFVLAGMAAVMQLMAFNHILGALRSGFRSLFLSVRDKWIQRLIVLALLAFGIKLLLQLISVFPVAVKMVGEVRGFVISYLHLVLLGFVSLFLLGFMGANNWIRLHGKGSGIGLTLFLSGFIFSELLIITQSILQWEGIRIFGGYYQLLFAVTMLMPVGLLIIYSTQLYYWYGYLVNKRIKDLNIFYFRSKTSKLSLELNEQDNIIH